MKKYISASMNNKQKRYYVSYCRIFKDGGKGSPDACYMYATQVNYSDGAYGSYREMLDECYSQLFG